MATRRYWLLLALNLVMPCAAAAPVGTGFTYQGELKVSGAPANGAFDFEFALFNVATAGSAIATVLRDDAPVVGGLFTVELDYTDVPFAVAQEYFLEVQVRDGASTGAYTTLLPRQKITPAPYAVNARTVQAGGVTQGAIATGAVGSAQLQTGAVANAQLGNLAVTGAKIADATISAAKLAFTPGDITDVVAGSGLTGGSTSGAATLTVNTGAIQSRVTGTCPVGEYFRGIAADGTVSCESVLAYLGITLRTTVDDPVNNVGEDTSIAIGTDGFPVISYRDGNATALKVAKCTNAACTGASIITTVDDPANFVGFNTSIAIGSEGLPVISYLDITANSLKVAKCANAACTGAATITTVDDPANSLGAASIAVSSDGLPVISYPDITAGTLKVAKCANAACTGVATITTVDSPANSVGFDVDIAIGSDGRPVISYRDSSALSLKVAKCANAACTGAATITTVDNPANSVGFFTSIAIGSGGLPVISYLDATTAALKVARCVNAACTGVATITTVDNPVNSIGSSTSIAIGSDGLPVISYFDASAGDLKVARCLNVACTQANSITADDSADTVGSGNAIAIGTDGLPVISYRNNTMGTLKVAKCGTPGCQ